jgi:hypothetical protein
VDGGQHADCDADAQRTAWLEANGWRVMRFWNSEILEKPEGVLVCIETALGGSLRRAPSPSQRFAPGPFLSHPSAGEEFYDWRRRRWWVDEAHAAVSFGPK